MPSPCDPDVAGTDREWVIHLQGFYGGTTCGCQPDYIEPLLSPGEMFIPDLTVWIKERRGIAGFGVNGMGAVRLVTVAAWTDQPKVRLFGTAADCLRDNMLNLKRMPRMASWAWQYPQRWRAASATRWRKVAET